jgi:hypothetical protein
MGFLKFKIAKNHEVSVNFNYPTFAKTCTLIKKGDSIIPFSYYPWAWYPRHADNSPHGILPCMYNIK